MTMRMSLASRAVKGVANQVTASTRDRARARGEPPAARAVDRRARTTVTARARATTTSTEKWIEIDELSDRASRATTTQVGRTNASVGDVLDGLRSRAGRAKATLRRKTTTRSAKPSASSAPRAVLELMTVPRTRARCAGAIDRGEALTRLFDSL